MQRPIGRLSAIIQLFANQKPSSHYVSEGPTDRDIVFGLRNGDRNAWSSLCQWYGERLWRYVARLIGSDGEAVADVYQETMLAVARSGRTLDTERTKLWSWLASIAHNQTALYWRHRYRDRSAPSDEDHSDARADNDPVAALQQQETIEDVRRLLADMNPEHATLLIAKYLDDLSVAEIVASTESTTEGVRSKLARARRDFRERYARLDGRGSQPADRPKPDGNSVPIVEEASADER